MTRVGHPALEIDGLSVTIDATSGLVPVIEEVSLQVGRGEIVGLLGESGSGKTMTAFAAIGLLPRGACVTAGDVRINGRSIGELSTRQLRQMRGSEVALIFQEPMTALNPVRRIASQLYDTLHCHRGLSRSQAHKRSTELLESLRVRDPSQVLDAYPHQLSGGLRQRVLIALALACDPDVFIADEITTAIDASTRREVLQLMREQVRQRDAGVLIISHDIAVIRDLCQRAVVMYRGQVVESGPTSAVVNSPRHPYTAMLLGAVPDGRRPKTMLTTAPSTAAPGEPARGCRFRDRCPVAEPRCLEPQPIRSAGRGHAVRCCKDGATT